MNNVHCLRQTGQSDDSRHPFHSNIFCRSDDSSTLSSGLCLSDHFDEHASPTHLQRYFSSSIVGTSHGQIVRKLLEMKFHRSPDYFKSQMNNDWLMIFLASKARLFCRRTKLFDPHLYPTLEQWIIMINCHCANGLDFYFDEPQANQLMCDYLDGLAIKGTLLFLFFSLKISSPFSSHLSGRQPSVDVCTIPLRTRTRFASCCSFTCD